MLSYILNYGLILSSILVFGAPFYVWFRLKNHDGFAGSISLEAERFFQSRQANWLVFTWAFSEALIWFVIPEFLLLLVVFMRLRRKIELLVFDIYGTIAGTALAYIINPSLHAINNLPYIQLRMITQTETWYHQHGIFGLAYQPFSGVPYKVFTFLAPHFHLFLPLFLIAAVFVRIARYYIFYAIFTQIYPVLHKRVYENYVPLFFVAIFIFSVLLLRVYQSYG